jgi:hypothetical protein
VDATVAPPSRTRRRSSRWSGRIRHLS